MLPAGVPADRAPATKPGALVCVCTGGGGVCAQVCVHWGGVCVHHPGVRPRTACPCVTVLDSVSVYLHSVAVHVTPAA